MVRPQQILPKPFRTFFVSLALFALALLPVRQATAFDPANGDFARLAASDIRVLQQNTAKNFIAQSSTDTAYQNVLLALNPDIISFNEIDTTLGGNSSAIATLIKNRLETIFSGSTWYVHVGLTDGFNRNALASRYPLSLTINNTTPAAPTNARGVTAALVDLPDGTYGSTDMYVMVVHMKSGGNTTGTQDPSDFNLRQRHADALTNWMRDARTAGGNINLAANTPMLIVGDANIGYQDNGEESPFHAEQTLLTGDIYDEATFGADSPGDWDGSGMADAIIYDYTNGNPRTQPVNSSSKSRLDRFYYTDSVLRKRAGFILATANMSSGALTAAGLSSTDSATLSDHHSCVVDFALGTDTSTPANLLINEFSFDDSGADDRSFVELRNTGGSPLNLEAPTQYVLRISSNNLPTSDPGTSNLTNSVLLKGVVPPGGVYVLYYGTGESSGIKTTIESALPSLQRIDAGSNSPFGNGPYAGIALMTQHPVDDSSARTDALVEAYAYDCTTISGDRYMRSANGLVVALAANQQTTFAGGVDTTVARIHGQNTLNSISQFTTGAYATPGTLNTPATVIDWTLQ